MNFKIITTAFLSAATIFSASLSVSAETSFMQDCPDYSQIKAQNIDLEYFDNAVNQLNKIAENPDDYTEDDVLEYAEILVEEYSFVKTLNEVYYIEFNKDVTDDSAYQKLGDSDVVYVEMNSDIGDCVSRLYNAGFEDALRNVNGYDLINAFTYVDFEEDYSEYDEENDQLLIEIDELVNEYMSYTEDDFSVEYDGETWVASDLFDNTIYSSDELAEISAQISEKRNETLGNIYLEILQKRNKLAENSGYDNYAEYAYACLFLRDYSYDEVSEIYDVVKDKFGDLSTITYDTAIDEMYDSELIDTQYSEGEIMNIVSDFLSDFNTDYLDNFNHMRTHHLYEINDDINSSGDSFTSALSAYSVPYMFISACGDFTDLTTVVHEFGHANAEYIAPSSAIWDIYGNSLDTCEIHSQGLEILFACNESTDFSEDERNANLKYTLSNMVYSISQGCLFDEFQRYAYENPDCTLDELNEKYSKLCKEYGIDYSPEDYYSYDWVEITHNFDSPMYYISYATSAASVLDLWLTAMEDYEHATEIYFDFTECCNVYAPYIEATEYAGLSTLFDKQALGDIAYQIEYYFNHEEIDSDYVPGSSDDVKEYDNISEFLDAVNEGEEARYESEDAEVTIALMAIMFAPLIIGGILFIIILIIVVCVVRHKDKKKKKQQEAKDHFDFL